ncbi:MAG: DivIVA domain-containing protein [Eubacteriales bacterium]|nr:DivIVA domain-containing protein [Eubacteriales bacterium]
MALDREYFDSINIELVKSKYYNANKVRAVLEDIRQQAQLLIDENARLRAQLQEQTKSRMELGDAVVSAQTVYNEIVERANACAASILKDAQRQHDEMTDESARRQDYAVKRVEQCITKLREQQLKCVELINLEWQSFLCGLDELSDASVKAAPADLDEKLSAIERELRMIEEE